MGEAQSEGPVLKNSVQRSHVAVPADDQIDVMNAGAVFVLESKGNWLHAGYHLTTSIVAPALLSLPFAFVGLGWVAGVAILFIDAALTFYGYFLFSKVYSQPTFEILEGKASDVKEGKFSARNLLPRLALRGGFVAMATFISAMLPFFGDINSLLGAFGFLPLDFILPATLYNIVFKPSRRSVVFWFNSLIALTFALVCIVASVAAVRQIVLDANTYKLFADL